MSAPAPSPVPPGIPRGPVPRSSDPFIRRRNRKRRGSGLSSFLLGLLWVLTLASGSVGAVWLFGTVADRMRPEGPMAGYLSTGGTVEREYRHYYGKPLDNPRIQKRFDGAADLVGKHRFAEAAMQLEAAAKEVPLPVFYNDLGVLYAKLNDRARAINAFRAALAHDANYQPVRFNLGRLKGLTADSAGPVTHEIEPNDSPLLANLITPGTPVDGEIEATTEDVDDYRVAAPPVPRDVLAIELTNHSSKFKPKIAVYDSDLGVLDWGKRVPGPGDSLSVYGSPAPNDTLFVEVSGSDNTGGAYTLKVKALKAYDQYEPNDDIFHATRLQIGVPLEANIMDNRDTDYYSFLAPRTGKVTVEVQNQSVTLTPALTTYGPDMRNTGFGPDLRTPGANLSHSMNVEQNQLYYVQVWPQGDSSGAYELTVH